MQFSINIKADNAAFDADPYMEVYRILTEIMDSAPCPVGEHKPLLDINGNAVGFIEVIN